MKTLKMANDKHLRLRKKEKQDTPSRLNPVDEPQKTDEQSENWNVINQAWFYLSLVVGVIVMVVIGYYYAWYCNELHEAQMWFVNIKEVEREISFRTESGLYYSYYKQMVNAKTVSQGLYELSHDNLTEHPQTINVLARMNIYQEVVLAVIYRASPYLQARMKPVFFYIYTIFGLNGGLVCALYVITWLLSGTWVAGALAAAFYVFNKADTSRVAYTIPLRESFSLPFLWAQFAILTFYFRPRRTKFQEKLCVVSLLLTTWLFALFWQFNQFILLLQSMALFGVQVLHIVPHYKVKTMYAVQIVSLLGVSVLQYFNTMIIGGLVFSFVPGALVLMYIQGEAPSHSGVVHRILKTLLYIIGVFLLMIVTNKMIKLFVHVDSDEHIYKFVLHKFGIRQSRVPDFDVGLYLCNGAFEFLDMQTILRLCDKGIFHLYYTYHSLGLLLLSFGVILRWRDMDVWLYLCVGSFEYLGSDTFSRLTEKLIFPLYMAAQLGGLLVIGWALVRSWRRESRYKKNDDNSTESLEYESWLTERPELAYHFIQTVFFGVMALTTLRMKYLWTPYMCILGSTLIADQYLYSWVFEKIHLNSKVLWEFLRCAICVTVFCALYYVSIGEVREELNNLREFYDPDTVQLMEWISKNTPRGAAFSGSMQLLAGVKLCTGRPITNHPHYEDKTLRHTTKQIYQIYSRKTAAEVHSILSQYSTSYIILEDSICLVPTSRECGTPNLIDMHNGVTSVKEKVEEGVTYTTAKKFCNEIRHMRPPFDKYFKEVFKNRTFRIYQVKNLRQS